MAVTAEPAVYLSTGVPGLDEVMGGGITPHRFYMAEGLPGTGKTTLGLQFLLAGVAAGETALYVTLSESEVEVRGIAASHGWELAGLHILEVVPSEDSLDPGEQYTVFAPDEVELGETLQRIMAEIERLRPSRVVIDSLSELRLLAGSALRYRRQLLGLKQFFAGRSCAAFVLDDTLGSPDHPQVHSIAHGIITLEQVAPDYGNVQRRLRVVKYRGMSFLGGFHDYRIQRGGLVVYPRLVAGDTPRLPRAGHLLSGSTGLDTLLGGGLERGTSTLIVGAPGTGKSTIAALYAASAVRRGERAAMFLFDETQATLYKRMLGMGCDLEALAATGRLHVQQVDPAEMPPGQFAGMVMEMATRDGASVVVIDSLNGYLHAMPDARFLNLQLHELLHALGRAGVCTVLVSVQQGLMGTGMSSPVEASYLADTVMLLRYFESRGAVHQVVSVIKKRTGHHERTLREFRIDARGVHVGEPLVQFRGVLTGVPSHVGEQAAGESLLLGMAVAVSEGSESPGEAHARQAFPES
jgi:circadian clock protein KaiC